jgi:hypothetical protein
MADASDAYARSLEEHGLEDVQPLYRTLLRKLKSQDASAYEQAVARYRADVETVEATSDTDPVAVWLAYGCWLAKTIEPGSLTAIAGNGRAEATTELPPLGRMLIHLPEATNRRGFVLAMPTKATPAQRETAALLCE